MATRRPIVLVSGVQSELPVGDVIDTGLNVTLQPNPSGLYFTGDNKLGFDGHGDNIQVIASGVGAVYRTVESKLQDMVSVKDFGAVGDGVVDDTAAIQAASLAVAAAGGGVLFFPPGTYRYTRLTIRTGVIFQGASSQNTFLVCIDPTTLDSGVAIGSSIRALDNGSRVSRAGFKDLFISSGSAGTGANQATYQNIIGINLCACERTVVENVSFGGFGQGALVLARAEAGAEGLGFVNTTQDGNYNYVSNISITSCGAYNSDTAAIWLRYKANSNKFYSIFAKGINGAYLFGIANGNDNAVFGGAMETGIGVARLGSGTFCQGNVFIGVRIEGGSGDGYVFLTNAQNNYVFGGYHTGVSGQDFNLTANPRNRVISDNTNWLKNATFPPPSSYSTLHNLGALNVTSINGDPTDPLFIKSKDTNTVGSYPYVVFYNDISNGATGNILGRIGFRNGDTSAGAAGVSGAIDAILEGSGGQTGLAFYSGTGTTLTEFLRLTNAGVLRPATDNIQSLGAAANRWSVVYAGTGTINTSDEREKQDTTELDDAERRVAVAVKGLIKKFRFKDAVQSKGDDARIHIGVVTQEVIAAFEAEGLDPMRYGIVCYDQWNAELDEDGIEVKPAGDRYGIRYEELLAFIITAL